MTYLGSFLNRWLSVTHYWVDLANLWVIVGVGISPMMHIWEEDVASERLRTGGKNISEARLQMLMIASVDEFLM
jgi:hypothetical protein